MSTQKELVKQKLDLLIDAPYEFIVASYNMAVRANLVDTPTFYTTSAKSKERMEQFEKRICPLHLINVQKGKQQVIDDTRRQFIEFYQTCKDEELRYSEKAEEIITLKKISEDKLRAFDYEQQVHEVFYAILMNMYKNELKRFNCYSIIDGRNEQLYSNNELHMSIYKGIVFGYDEYNPDHVFYTNQEEVFMQTILDEIKDSCEQYLNSEDESEQE